MHAALKMLNEEAERARNLTSLLSSFHRFSAKDRKRLRSKHPFVIEASSIQEIASKVGNPSTGYDGIYLSVCATFELTFRSSIEDFIDSINDDIQDFSSIPITIRNWHPKGCASIINNLSNSKFDHLTTDLIITSLSSCQSPSNRKPAKLLPEAFSWHDNNLRNKVIENILSTRIGIEKPWKKIAKRESLKSLYGTDNEQTIERLTKKELDQYIERRNNIIHRGRNYYTASETDIEKSSYFFEMLLTSIVDVLEKHKENI